MDLIMYLAGAHFLYFVYVFDSGVNKFILQYMFGSLSSKNLSIVGLSKAYRLKLIIASNSHNSNIVSHTMQAAITKVSTYLIKAQEIFLCRYSDHKVRDI